MRQSVAPGVLAFETAAVYAESPSERRTRREKLGVLSSFDRALLWDDRGRAWATCLLRWAALSLAWRVFWLTHTPRNVPSLPETCKTGSVVTQLEWRCAL
jgi:hypothetical protein